MTEATFLPTYLETLDRSPLDVLPMLAPDFAFSVLWDDEDGAKEWNGGLDEFHGYLAQRDPEGYAHHVHSATRDRRPRGRARQDDAARGARRHVHDGRAARPRGASRKALRRPNDRTAARLAGMTTGGLR